MLVFFIPGSHNTHRWIRFGGHFTFQPSEIAKPVLVLFLAWFLHSRLDKMRDLKQTLLRAVIMPVVFILLIVKQPDLGTALVLAGVTAMVLVLAGMEWKYLLAGVVAMLPGLAALLFMVAWRRQRMLVFLHPNCDAKDAAAAASYHVCQSLIAVGSGGFTGRGFMEGMQKLFYLPEAPTDFIFANIAEELGFIGAIAIVARSLSSSACAACAPPFAPRIPLPAWSPSASPPASCSRPSSTSAWCSPWSPPRAFRCP